MATRLLQMGLACVLLTACGAGSEEPTIDTPDETTAEPSSVLSNASTTAIATTTTSTTPPTSITTTTISPEQLARAEEVGDVATGEELFFTGLEGIPHDFSCSSCHTLDGTPSTGPSLLGISEVAGERIEGLSDVEYLRQTLNDPLAFDSDEESTNLMPYQYAEVLTDEQVDDVVAFLLTR